ncbi:hypothetical protein EYZ11_010930 [Aspergillus tanneri]|uniref:Uncharacterized protein n=1 Tax=Aspergillus tanneri TaxID=1220188 RepID=A0A4S3J434_9EURO|nr:hypothetical protein EYZ11_010930 [Aspergillus tanneri]
MLAYTSYIVAININTFISLIFGGQKPKSSVHDPQDNY